jgi:hypothetical protein
MDPHQLTRIRVFVMTCAGQPCHGQLPVDQTALRRTCDASPRRLLSVLGQDRRGGGFPSDTHAPRSVCHAARQADP